MTFVLGFEKRNGDLRLLTELFETLSQRIKEKMFIVCRNFSIDESTSGSNACCEQEAIV